MLRFPGVAAERAERLRGLVDVGWAVTLERAIDEGLEVCVIEGRGRRVTGRGATPDEAAADALAQVEGPGA